MTTVLTKSVPHTEFSLNFSSAGKGPCMAAKAKTCARDTISWGGGGYFFVLIILMEERLTTDKNPFSNECHVYNIHSALNSWINHTTVSNKYTEILS